MTALILMLLALLLVVPPFFIYRAEKREYNNGYCACGARWIHFECDSQGGDGWKCAKCGAGFWSSWIRPKNIYYGRIVE